VSVTGTVSANADCSISRLLRVDAGGTIDVTGYNAVLLADASGTALVHDNGGVTLGDFTVEQYLIINNNYANIYYSSPVNNATVGEMQDDCNMLVTGNANSFYYNEATGQWLAPGSYNYPMANGQGFYQFAYLSTSYNNIFDFTGELNTGDISIPISNSNGGGWNIIGNPYPSPMSLTALFDGGNNPGVFYRYNVNSYNTFIAALGISNPPGLTADVPTMQGFWVREGDGTANDPAFGQVDYNNSMRITDPAASVDDFTKSTMPLFRLAMEYQSERVNSVVYFFNGATDGVDGIYDAVYLDGDNSFQFATKTGNTNISINALPELDGSTVTIPLHTEISVLGNYTISLTELSNFSSGSKVMLQIYCYQFLMILLRETIAISVIR
jgi:hypothetical protein